MWYLKAFTIVSLLGLSVFNAMLGAWVGAFGQALRKPIILLFSLSFLGLYSQKLVVFALLYVICNYGLYRLVLGMTGLWRKWAFSVSIAANIGMMLLLRLFSEGLIIHPWFAPVLLLGLIYTLLKVISTFYHAYYIADKPGPGLVEYACYLLFIPTFTSGPLIKFHEFLKDLRSPHRLTGETLEWAVKRIIKGLFKKLVLANLLMLLYNDLIAGELNAGSSSLVLITFYILLFFDFSGYSDIAIGFGYLLGIRVPENFKKPFSSPTLTQFWRNWHATLGDWFRDHIFLFWAGKTPTRLYSGVLSFIIMVLVGLWHGLELLFLLWGAYHGFLLFLENIWRQTTVNKRKVSRTHYWTRCILVNMLVAFGTIFFSENLGVASKILKGFLVW